MLRSLARFGSASPRRTPSLRSPRSSVRSMTARTTIKKRRPRSGRGSGRIK